MPGKRMPGPDSAEKNPPSAMIMTIKQYPGAVLDRDRPTPTIAGRWCPIGARRGFANYVYYEGGLGRGGYGGEAR